ncbi:response regulator [Cohnella nanjingensis]|uniref:Response regulator n=1 Tax=Cohnella nanjingensis TaxID=1387779 RepID=A0A7X0RTW0_9BACL|nr:response regulator [Cohnella nanjingensis]MBB6672315.1 response regulator [Cohnella nanjingensis]
MYKVLLADDEILDLEGMRTFIPWPELGLTVAGAVNNGFAACEVIESEKIDILVTDIRMPNMSGLELAKRAQAVQSDLRVIFVSGHQDFQYAKQAMTLNANGYVLKPMDDKELIAALMGVKRELDQGKRRQEEKEAFRQLVPIAKNEYLLQLLESPAEELSSPALKRAYSLDRLNWPIRVVVLEIDDYTWKLNPYSEFERKALLNRFYAMLSARLTEHGIHDVCRLSKQRTALLLGSDVPLDVMGALMDRVRETFPFTVTLGLGNAAHGLSEIHAAHSGAVAALEQKMLRGKGRLLVYEESRHADLEDLKGLDGHLATMLQAMARYDLVRAHDELSSVFRLAAQLGSKITIRHFSMYVILKLNEHLRGMREDLFRLLGLELKNLDILLQFETIDDIHSWLRRKVFELSETLQAKKQSKNGRLVESVVAHVRERLQENITLREVAERFSFSPNHLGLLFKEETARNFSEFVIDLRMEKAQRLLRETKLKIYEVADRVGYRYLPYFSRQFKETTGMTPMAYRRKH